MVDGEDDSSGGVCSEVMEGYGDGDGDGGRFEVIGSCGCQEEEGVIGTEGGEEGAKDRGGWGVFLAYGDGGRVEAVMDVVVERRRIVRARSCRGMAIGSVWRRWCNVGRRRRR